MLEGVFCKRTDLESIVTENHFGFNHSLENLKKNRRCLFKSFMKIPVFPVSEVKQQELKELMAHLGIQEQDLFEEFLRGGGPGGQKINKTSVAVQLTHVPSGVVVRCQEGRSQIMNRYYALKRLVEKIEAQVLGERSARQQAIEKIRRQKRKRSRRAQEKVLQGKRATSVKKGLRKKPASWET